MESIDNLTTISKHLYDNRVADQRNEIERLKKELEQEKNKTIIIESLNYLVIASGYTSRLLDNIEELKREIIDELGEDTIVDPILFIAEEADTDSDIDSDSESIPFDKERGLYKIGDETEIDTVFNMIKGSSYLTGSICMKCFDLSQAFRLFKNLGERDFCGGFNISNVYKLHYLKNDKTKILVMSVDCESG